MNTRALRFFLALAALGPAAAMVPACKTNTIDNATNITTVNATTVGAQGGIVVGPNGVQVRVPGGALTSDTRISIRVADPAEYPALFAGETVDGSIYALEPHGLKFLSPVTVSLPGNTSNGATIYHAEVGAKNWTMIPNATLTSKGAEFVVTTFSFFAPTHPNDGSGTATPNTAPSGSGATGGDDAGRVEPPPPCGSPGLACCTSGTACTPDSECQSGQCVMCGRGGQKCCAGNTCADEVRWVCVTGSCADCGKDGQVCCGGATKCLGGLTCNGSNVCAF